MGSVPSKISASRGAAVLGLSHWATPVQVWQQIMEEIQPGFNAARGYVLPEFVENAAMRWGLAFEDSVIMLAGDRAERAITDRERLHVHPDHDFLTCHIDGRYAGDGPLHEGKTTNSRSFYSQWGEPGSDRIPQHYAVQVQHQMLCSGATEAIVSVLVFPRMVDEFEAAGMIARDCVIVGVSDDGSTDWERHPMDYAEMLADMGFFHQYRIAANPEAQASMLAAYRNFWENHVLTGIAPPVQTYDDIKRLIPEPYGTVIATDEIVSESVEYKGIGEEIAKLKKRQDAIKARMIAAAMTCDRTLDDESVDAIVIRDTQGRKLHKYGKTAKGVMFR